MSKTKIDKLPGGLTLVTLDNHAAPVAAFQVWLHVGSHDELDDERGLAHLHEHMLFKGTPTRGVGAIAADIEAAGGNINAWTSQDQTVYHIVMPSHAWRAGLEVLADAVCHPLFDPDELEREIEVVVEEIKRSEDSPSRVLYRRLFELIWAGHPYALPVLGTEQSVRSMTQARMRAFYDKHYTAPNATVVAVGDFDPEEVRAEVQRLFADLAATQPPARVNAPEPRPPAAAAALPTTFSESRLVYAFPAPGLSHPDVPALDVLAIVLGQGDSSRLFREVRRDQGLVNDIGASCYTPERCGMFSVSLLTSRDRLKPALEASLDVLARLLETGIDELELEKARNIVLSEATYKLETVQGMANSMGYYQVTCDDPDWEQGYHAAVARLRTSDVLRAARTWLRPEAVQVVQMLAEDTEDADGDEGAGADLALDDAPDGQPDEAEVLDEAGLLSTVQRRLGRFVGTPLAAREADVIEGIELTRLDSGDVLLVRPDRSVPVAALRVAGLGGLLAETPATAGHTRLLSDLLTRGTASRSADDFADTIDRLAVDLGGFAGRNSIGMSALCLSQHLEPVLEMMTDCLWSHALPDQELQIQREAQLEDIRHQHDAPARTCFRALLQAMYGAHPYGLDSLGTLESVGAADQAALLGLGRGLLGPGRLVWAAAGDLDVDQLTRRLNALTPTDPREAPPLTNGPVAPLTEKVQLRNKADKAQAHIAIGFRGTTLSSPDRHALAVLSTVLSGQGGRLFLELRDRQSLAYSVSSMSVEGVDPGYFAFYIGTSPDKEQTALAGLYGEIDKVLQAPVLAEELDRAKAYLAGAHAIGLQRSSSRAATIAFNHLYGLGRESWRTQLEDLLAVTAEDVLEAARRTLTVGRHVESVLAPQ